jgi:hypothetical protein
MELEWILFTEYRAIFYCGNELSGSINQEEFIEELRH